MGRKTDGGGGRGGKKSEGREVGGRKLRGWDENRNERKNITNDENIDNPTFECEFRISGTILR